MYLVIGHIVDYGESTYKLFHSFDKAVEYAKQQLFLQEETDGYFEYDEDESYVGKDSAFFTTTDTDYQWNYAVEKVETEDEA